MKRKQRQEIYQQRNLLPLLVRQKASKNIAYQFNKATKSYNYQNIAIYIAFKSEINLNVIIKNLRKSSKNLFIPVINPLFNRYMYMQKWRKDDKLKMKKYKIKSLDLHQQNIISKHRLKIIIVPLVAFDNQRNRLGNGGGFYDKYLQNIPKHTLLIGAAYEMQQVPNVAMENFDKQLNLIITEKQLYS